MDPLALLDSTATFTVLTVIVAAFLTLFITGRARAKGHLVAEQDIPEPVRRRVPFMLMLYSDVVPYVCLFILDLILFGRYTRLLHVIVLGARYATPQSMMVNVATYRANLLVVGRLVYLVFPSVLVLESLGPSVWPRFLPVTERGYVAVLQKVPTGLGLVDELRGLRNAVAHPRPGTRPPTKEQAEWGLAVARRVIDHLGTQHGPFGGEGN